MKISTIGIDLEKNAFAIYGAVPVNQVRVPGARLSQLAWTATSSCPHESICGLLLCCMTLVDRHCWLGSFRKVSL
jgi:hypothetical protein